MPKHLKYPVFFIVLILLLESCKKEQPKQEVALYNKYCSSCHIAPKIDELPKDIWENSVLPAMVARMDVEGMYQDPNQIKAGFRPKITLQEWSQIQNYVLSVAPEKLEPIVTPQVDTLKLFEPSPMALDEQNGAMITFLGFKDNNSELFYGDVTGKLGSYNFKNNTNATLYQGKTPITWYNQKDGVELISEVGILGPSELEQGKLVLKKGMDTVALNNKFHRPVHALFEDLNKDGSNEIVVGEFGNETGKLSLLTENSDHQYNKTDLLNLPGCIRTLAKDMNNDGRLDIVALMSQSNESITIFYQTGDLVFEPEKVVEFSPVYGLSWFELVDYNGDGFDDIITVNGDNADISYVNKPYHGMRIHLNNGDNTFTETYFYPMYGATRVVARDFDQDSDLDFALISTFVDYRNFPEFTFVYLENKNSDDYDFDTKILEDPTQARWFLMDASDIDDDGDDDIVLSSFTLVFSPVPKEFTQRWNEENVDIVILENKLH